MMSLSFMMELRTIDFDLGPGPFTEQDAVTLFQTHGEDLAVFAARSRTHSHDLTFLRLLGGGVGNDDAARGFAFGVDPTQGDTIVEGTKFHGVMLQGDWTPVSATSRLRISRIRL